MFQKKKPKPDQDRLGRQRQPRIAERGNTAVFSYHASRSARPGTTGRTDPEAAAPAAAARRGKPHLLRRPLVLLGIGAALVIAVVNLFLRSTPQVILDPTAAAVPLRNPAVYTAAATSLLGASPLNKSKLTINTARISAELRARFPELAQVTVSVPFIGTAPVVHIAPTPPQLLLNAGTQLYVINASGRALMKANEVPGIEKLNLPIVNDQSGLAITAGKSALPASNVAFITEVIGQLKTQGLTITNSTLPAGSSEMDIHISGVSYIVKFNLQGNGRAEAGAFLAVKAQLDREHKLPQEYIDVRVEERAYYK